MKARNPFGTSQLHYRDPAPLAFAFFALGGSAAVVLSKEMGWDTWAVIAVPVVCLFSYTLMALFLPRLTLRLDQIGDNVYYLGFLLTLVSLTTTLIEFSNQKNNDYIISNFGVALAATIFGIFLRTLIGQMRKDVVGIEKEMHASLREASMRLRSQAFLVIESFGSLHKQISQVTQESSNDISQSHRELAAGLTNIVDEHTKALAGQVDASVNAISNKTESIITKLEAVSNTLINSISKEQKALELSAAQAHSMLSSFENLKIDYGSLKQVEDSLISFSQNIEESYQSASERMNDTFSSINIDLAPLTLVDKSILSFSDSLTQNMSKVASDFSLQVEALEVASAKFAKCSDEMDRNVALRYRQISEQLEWLNKTNSTSIGVKKTRRNTQPSALERWHSNT